MEFKKEGLNEKIVNFLKGIETDENRTKLEKEVASDLLDEEEILVYMKDIITHGCISGMVGNLIYHDDTEKFFISYMADIFELFNEVQEELGEYPFSTPLNADTMAWFGYEETVRSFLEEMEIEV